MVKCEVCDKDVLARLYFSHQRRHQQKDSKQDEAAAAAAANVEMDSSAVRGPRAAAQKFVQCQLYSLYVCACFPGKIFGCLCSSE